LSCYAKALAKVIKAGAYSTATPPFRREFPIPSILYLIGAPKWVGIEKERENRASSTPLSHVFTQLFTRPGQRVVPVVEVARAGLEGPLVSIF